MPARGSATGRQPAIDRQLAVSRLTASGRLNVDGGVVDDMVFLSEVIVSAATAANITFSAISGAYRHLQIIYVARSDAAAGGANILVRFNGDSGANYDWTAITVQNTTVSGTTAVGQTAIVLGRLNGSGSPAGTFASGTMTFPYYSTTTQDKMGLGSSGSSDTNLATGQFWQNFSGNWYTANAAITSIVLVPSANAFVQNSRASLYGIT